MPKTDPRIEAYGTVDELNAAIGLALNYVKNKQTKKTLIQAMNDLFRVGAELAAAGTSFRKIPKITARHTENIEKKIYAIEKKLPKQKSFILPLGTLGAAHLHLAKAICRRAERKIVYLKSYQEFNPEIIKYLNRLSDLLFICARLENKGKDVPVKYD